ncbi:MAG TPA: terminase TerL endonuclease subunit [Thiohalobacter sp.]|nr:terminase TerL endonuclease subunit [Thiohalobacter sp.]
MAVRSLTRGQRNIAWIEAHCLTPEGRDVGKPIKLRSWQRKVIRGIYDSRTRLAIISFGRKNGKTALAAMLLLLHLVGPEARPNSQLYSAAQSRDQASILFALAAKMVRLSVDLSQYVTVRDTAKQLYCEDLGTLYRALSAEASTAYGLSPVFIVHDELGQVKGPRSELYEALETACGAQDEPLSVVISTQAPTDADLLSTLIDDAKSKADPRVKLYMFSAPEDIDPFSVKAVRAANPAYGDFLNKDEVDSQLKTAKRMPSRENAYRNLILNQRISQFSPFIPRAMWEACSGEVDPTAFDGQVYIGLDLSARNDLTALAMIGKDADGRWNAQVEFFAPESGLLDRAHRDRVPYDVWVQQGYITATPGASVDYAFVAHRLVELCDDYDVQVISFDRWRVDVLNAELLELGAELPLEPFGQGYKDMAPAVDTIESEIANGNLRHGDNPVLTWCAANAVVISDPAGNRKLDKSKSTGRIDGMVALCMAIGRTSIMKPPTESVYEQRGIRTL